MISGNDKAFHHHIAIWTTFNWGIDPLLPGTWKRWSRIIQRVVRDSILTTFLRIAPPVADSRRHDKCKLTRARPKS
jgi:hypothetical protein